MAVCAFIGLGNMGYPMAGHLMSAGHEVRVFNRTEAKAERWAAEHGGVKAALPAEAAAGADLVFICVGADNDVRAVTYGDTGVLGALSEGAVLVDHTTASATLATELAAATAERGIGFVDGPISGGQAGAENGALSVMCGGEQEHFDAAANAMEAYSSTMTLVGPAGSGQLTKMVNQILCAGAIQGAAEALAFGQSAGLDMERVLSAVTQGAAGSWYLSNRGHTMVADEFDFGFAIDWMAKDLGLVRAEAESRDAAVPLTDLTADYVQRAQAAGDNRADVTAIIRQYRDA
jgi:3-hydroxyisobutyrate dehydrogenase